MPLRRVLAYAAIYVVWGGSFLAIREAVAVVPPFLAAGFRFTLAGLVLLVSARVAGPIQLGVRQMVSAALLGLIMFTCLYAGLFWAETRVTSGIAAVVSGMIPVWIFTGELLVLRTRRATVLSIGGTLAGFAGVILLAAGTGSGGSGNGAGRNSGLAVLAMAAGTLCWSAGTVLSRRLSLPRPQRANAGWQMAAGGVLLLALAAASGEFRHLPGEAVLLSARVVVSMGYLVIFASIITYTAYVWLIAHDSPTRVSSYAYVNPLFALILGAVLAGERLNPVQMCGAALVIAGVLATLMGRGARQAAAGTRAGAGEEAGAGQRT